MEKRKENKTKEIFDNLKNDYFLQKLFCLIETRRKLEIIKYNTNIKKRINININDYKEYSLIEIDIFPVNNEYGEFIKIKDKPEYYHIYFNNNNEEMKRNYLYQDDKITKIKIIIDYQIKSFKKLFYNCECIEYINFTKFFRTNITDMSYMFCGCL